MMAGVTQIFTFICIAGCHLSSASPACSSGLVVPAVPVGQNVSFTCNQTSSVDITWYRLRSDQLQPLLTAAQTKLRDVTVSFHTADGRFSHRGDMEGGPLALEIQEVKEEDAGLYFCTGRCGGGVCVDRGIHLVVGGVDGEPARQPCWTLGICVLPAVLVLGLVSIVGLACLRSGQPAVCCCSPARTSTGQTVTEEVSLHYSSRRHADKPRLSGRGGAGLVEDDITYSTVTSRKNPNGSHGHQ